MAIVTIGNTKGGVGKSTTAVQLAIGLSLTGARVWLVDGDRQQTSLAAITIRAESDRPTIAAAVYTDGKTLRSQVTQQRGDYDHIVIDAGGRDSTALRAALYVSDTVLIPFLPRSFDVWALNDMAELIDTANSERQAGDLRALAFLNLADTQGEDNREASAAVADFPSIELLPFSMGRRKAYAYASGAGLHVEEYKPRNPIACAEVDRIMNAVFGA